MPQSSSQNETGGNIWKIETAASRQFWFQHTKIHFEGKKEVSADMMMQQLIFARKIIRTVLTCIIVST